MKRLLSLSCALAFGATLSHAAVVGVSGGVSSAGTGPSIIAAPTNALDDGTYNTAIQAFDEQQGYVLGAALAVDGGTIAAGTKINSHMVFLNSGPGNNRTLIEHGAGGNQNAVEFTFDGMVLGVMSDDDGALEVASQFLGATGTTYPAATFAARGMEDDPLDGSTANDWYAFAGNSLSLGMRVTEPGDWIRVITAVSTVPVPAGLPLMLAGLGGLGLAARRKKRKAS